MRSKSVACVHCDEMIVVILLNIYYPLSIHEVVSRLPFDLRYLHSLMGPAQAGAG